MDDLSTLVTKFYAVPGVLGIRARWEELSNVHIRVRYDTPEVRSAIKQVMRGRPYTLEVLQLTEEQARELDATIAATKVARVAGLKRAKERGTFGVGWGPTGDKAGAYGAAMQALREGAERVAKEPQP